MIEKNRTMFARKSLLLVAVIPVFFFFLCYWRVVKGLYEVWANNPDYSYAFLIPAIVCYLVWERRAELSKVYIKWNPYGGAAFIFFLLVSAYGVLGSSPSAARPALPLIVLSGILFCFGPEVFTILLFPLSLLIFMIPLPTIYGSLVGVHLKALSTKLGEAFLRTVGVSVYVEGNIIDLGVIQLQVIDACSGLRYVLPLMALAAILGYFLEKNSWWKRLVLFLAAIPVAIVANGIRIGTTGLLADRFGSDVAQGFFHGFSGWLIFMLAFALLYSLHVLLNLIPPGHFASSYGGKSKMRNVRFRTGFAVHRSTYYATGTVASLFLALALFSYASGNLPRVSLKGGISSFPREIGKWIGHPRQIDTTMVAASGAEEAFDAEYNNNTGDIVSLYIGYRGSPFLENYNFFHSPSVCLPSSGWKTVLLRKHTICTVYKFKKITVSEMIVEKMGTRELVYYWFQTKDKATYNKNINRFHLALHAIRKDNTYDLFIRLITPLEPMGNVETIDQKSLKIAEERLDGFARDLMDTLLDFVKNNQISEN